MEERQTIITSKCSGLSYKEIAFFVSLVSFTIQRRSEFEGSLSQERGRQTQSHNRTWGQVPESWHLHVSQNSFKNSFTVVTISQPQFGQGREDVELRVWWDKLEEERQEEDKETREHGR